MALLAFLFLLGCLRTNLARVDEIPYQTAEYWDKKYRSQKAPDHWIWTDAEFTEFLPGLLIRNEPAQGKQQARRVVELGHGFSDMSYILHKALRPESVTSLDYSQVAHERMLRLYPPESHAGLNFVHGNVSDFLKRQKEGGVDILFEAATLDTIRTGGIGEMEIQSDLLQPLFRALHPKHGVYVSGSLINPASDTLKLMNGVPWDSVHMCRMRMSKEMKEFEATIRMPSVKKTVWVMMRGPRKNNQPLYYLADKKFTCWDTRDTTRTMEDRKENA